ncbi:hypothetical protein BDW02DRAFT_625513 [Decorospora gaudefroyi]|uniref:Uncharacterized protein n=1 Tax=Decorospora gaudefroyi TaxID=184978 RepID=A0A6A5K5N0_9PLEO|nr:hypothetical protein BDW02DRAFT_625513 [Decorospora gaudefroyi]
MHRQPRYIHFITSKWPSSTSLDPQQSFNPPFNHHQPSTMNSPPDPPSWSPTPTDNDIHVLTHQLQHTNLDGKRAGQWTYLRPGTTREEQLRIIADENETKQQQEKKEKGEKEAGDGMTIQQAMDTHLAMLASHSLPHHHRSTNNNTMPPSKHAPPTHTPTPHNCHDLERLDVDMANRVDKGCTAVVSGGEMAGEKGGDGDVAMDSPFGG